MALYKWVCLNCQKVSKKLLDNRPELPPCPECGGSQSFDTKATSSTKEVLDGWTMRRSMERDPDIKEKLAERNRLADAEADVKVDFV